MLTELARARARNLVNAVAQLFVTLGVSPNGLTIIGLLGVIVIAGVIAAGYEALGGVLLILAAAFDSVDGALARLTGRVTKFGAFLDSSLDRWAEGALFFGIALSAGQRQDMVMVYLAVLALIGSLMVSYTRARAEGLGANIKAGWFTRFERFIVLIAGLILTAWFGPPALTVALAVIALFANLTAVQRVLAARQMLQ